MNSNYEFLTPKEIAEILKISYPQALEVIKNSGIGYVKIGNQYRISKEKFDKFFAQKGNIVIYL